MFRRSLENLQDLDGVIDHLALVAVDTFRRALPAGSAGRSLSITLATQILVSRRQTTNGGEERERGGENQYLTLVFFRRQALQAFHMLSGDAKRGI